MYFRLNNYHFLSSEGFFVRSPPLMMSSSFNGFMTLNIESMTWEEVPGNYFGICKFPQNGQVFFYYFLNHFSFQKDAFYFIMYFCNVVGSISCIDTSTINGSLVFEHLDISPLTTSICIQLCLGKDANFTVVLEGGCKCFSEVSYDHKFGQCKACSGHETQMCGDDNGNSGVLVNLGIFTNVNSLYMKIQYQFFKKILIVNCSIKDISVLSLIFMHGFQFLRMCVNSYI